MGKINCNILIRPITQCGLDGTGDYKIAVKMSIIVRHWIEICPKTLLSYKENVIQVF